jgi:hypothetical protein
VNRVLAVLAFAAMLSAPAVAADHIVKLTLDGRPVDRSGGSAVLHNGIVYADAVDLVRSFDGVLTFQGKALVVTVNGVTATFTAGSRTARVANGSTVMPGPAFVRNGDLFVPLELFITRVANARVRISADKTRANISVNANPLS